MKKIDDLFADFFDTKETTNERLVSFGRDHFSRTTNNNPGGVFSTILAATQTAINNLHSANTQEAGSIGDRKGGTFTKNETRADFNEFISKGEGAVKYAFGKPSEEYTQFFPEGLSVFYEATDQGYAQLVQNIVNRATQYETQLGTTFKTTAETLANAYLHAEDDQTDDKGTVASRKEDADLKRLALTRQLTINALTIALQFPLDKTKPEVYFDTSLLFAQHRKRLFRGTPAAGASVKICDILYEAGKEVQMWNRGAGKLQFQMHLQGNAVGEVFELDPNQKIRKKMDEFFSNADALWVTNPETVIGKYNVRLIA